MKTIPKGAVWATRKPYIEAAQTILADAHITDLLYSADNLCWATLKNSHSLDYCEGVAKLLEDAWKGGEGVTYASDGVCVEVRKALQDIAENLQKGEALKMVDGTPKWLSYDKVTKTWH